MAGHLLAIDQGTTGSTCLVMDTEGVTLGRASREFPQHFPQPGWVEHDPEELWASVMGAVREALRAAHVVGSEIAAIGITNQRETTLLWDRQTGVPIQRAIVWQDRRTAARCAELEAAGHEALVRERTGLVLDPYFSGTKLAWLLDQHPGARERAAAGELAFGTVDSYLVWRLAGGAGGLAAPHKDAPHVTDATNASRTLLMDLATRRWDPELCEILGVPSAVLPRIVPSAAVVGHTQGLTFLPDGIPIAGIAGDQHAALFGQACLRPGQVKCTYGTGAFVVMNTGSRVVKSQFGLLSTLAWQLGDEAVYALEGSAFIAGAAVQWLRDSLGIITSASETEALARSVPDAGGVHFVPALVGLGAPYWDPEARGLISGITRGTTRAHLVRATLDAIALQVTDLVRAMGDDLGEPLSLMRVDGGAAANDLLMQLQSDLAGLTVERPSELETTARGAAMLAGIGVGLYRDAEDAARTVKIQDQFRVSMSAAERDRALAGWHSAVRRARGQAV
ncbi:MAG: glycerol kinase GlpK [Polyangiaceae bacterium]|nr:glycerol kinase GlpK [Polyangiaceae bacterium]MCW5788890.1 glycerol kinase GlpK [Polyangiaceae bacterium]